MLSLPDIARRLARRILAEVPEIGSLTRRQIATLAGIAPFTRQSGKHDWRCLLAAGKPKIVALIAVARKILNQPQRDDPGRTKTAGPLGQKTVASPTDLRHAVTHKIKQDGGEFFMELPPFPAVDAERKFKDINGIVSAPEVPATTDVFLTKLALPLADSLR